MTDLSQIDESDWNEAQQRAEILRPLVNLDRCPHHLANKAAIQLKLSMRQIYTLINRLREADGVVTALLPNRSKSTGPILVQYNLRRF